MNNKKIICKYCNKEVDINEGITLSHCGDFCLNHADRENMTPAEEKLFIKKWYDKYEKVGFSETFHTPYEDFAFRNESQFKVLRRVEFSEEADLSMLPRWEIEFEDNTKMLVYPEEIVKSSDVRII